MNDLYTHPQAPKTWIDHYGNDFQCITKENYLAFIV